MLMLFPPPADGHLIATLYDPEDFARTEAYRRVRDELDIAQEIFLAKHWNKVHYGDLMDSVPPDTASKEMLISWLNDYRRKDAVKRRGVITLYRLERGDHFPGGMWSAGYLCQAVEFLIKKLLDPEYVKDINRAAMFRDSFANPDWYWKAVPVFGLKLLEECYRQGALKSQLARSYLRLTINCREHYENFAKIIGRCTKNHEIDLAMYRELREEAEAVLKEQLDLLLQTDHSHQEHLLYEKYEPLIRESLLATREGVMELVREEEKYSLADTGQASAFL